MKVIDAEVLLKFLNKEKGYEKVKRLFVEAVALRKPVLLSAADWAALCRVIIKQCGKSKAGEVFHVLEGLPLKIVDLDPKTAVRAAVLEAEGMPYGRCCAKALSESKKAELFVL